MWALACGEGRRRNVFDGDGESVGDVGGDDAHGESEDMDADVGAGEFEGVVGRGWVESLRMARMRLRLVKNAVVFGFGCG